MGDLPKFKGSSPSNSTDEKFVYDGPVSEEAQCLLDCLNYKPFGLYFKGTLILDVAEGERHFVNWDKESGKYVVGPEPRDGNSGVRNQMAAMDEKMAAIMEAVASLKK